VNSLITLKLKAERIFETSRRNNPTTRRNPEDLVPRRSREGDPRHCIRIAKDTFVYNYISFSFFVSG